MLGFLGTFSVNFEIPDYWGIGKSVSRGFGTVKREQRENNMISKDYAIAKELKERLSNVTSVVDLIIFGSRARGDQDEYSDMDVFIEVATLDKDLKERIYEIVWEVGFENFMVISPLICAKDEIENSALRSAPIVKNIFEEGIRI